MAAECGAALLHFSFAAFALGLKRTLFVLSGVLVFGDIKIGNPVRLDYDVADTLPIRYLSRAFSIAV